MTAGPDGQETRPDILACIGGTRMVALNRIVPASGARILMKLESDNPTGSMKDRMALAMIEAASPSGCRLSSRSPQSGRSPTWFRWWVRTA